MLSRCIPLLNFPVAAAAVDFVHVFVAIFLRRFLWFVQFTAGERPVHGSLPFFILSGSLAITHGHRTMNQLAERPAGVGDRPTIRLKY